MRRGPLAAACVVITSVALLIPAIPSFADGLPVFGDAGLQGVSAPAGGDRYFTVFSRGRGDGETLVEQVTDDGGRIADTARLDGYWAIPPVAYDNSTTGLSADGTTLALVRPGFGAREVSMLVLDTAGLKVADRIHLDGTFSLDAISPDGGTLYLIHYRARYGGNDYRVQPYDVATRQLGPAIVDPEEPDEKMGGYPMARAYSPSGRWAYTLYDGGHEPFIHALDTARGEAACIELDHGLVPQRELFTSRLELAPSAHALSVVGRRNGPLATVDTKTFEVTDPTQPPAEHADAAGGVPWPALAVGLAALLAGGAAFVAVRRRRRAPEPDWAALSAAAGHRDRQGSAGRADERIGA